MPTKPQFGPQTNAMGTSTYFVLLCLKVWVMGIFTILILCSCTAWLFINVGFQPVEFGMGLAVFACRYVLI